MTNAVEPEPIEPEPVESEPASYARAIDELEAILAELEDDALDVDHLAERVGRAAVLIRACRERISGARLEVERIVADLDGAGPEPAGAAPVELPPPSVE